MKKYIYIISFLAAFTLTGCSKWLAVNDNPNYVSDADVQLLMPTAQLITADKVGYDISLVGYFWSQYVIQNKTTNQYTTIMNNDLSVSTSYFTRPWSYTYARTLPTLKTILDKCNGKDGYSNFVLEAKAMEAYNLYMLTSLYDKVAYKEGPMSDDFNANPSFETGKQMQEIILGILEDVRSMDAAAVAADEATNSSATADMVFSGDTDSWFQFANTLYLKLLLRDFTTNKTKIQSLLAEDNFLAADAAFDKFLDAADKSNPLYENDRRGLNTKLNIRCCSDILNVLSANDPRLEYYYVGGGKGEPYGTNTDPEVSNLLNIAATDAVYFSTVDEVHFLKAEAYARLNDAVNAKSSYEAAVTAAFTRCGCTGADTFLAGDYAFTAGTTEEMLEQILNQKWAANVRCMPIESWFDINRTGYPAVGTVLTDFTGVLDGRPVRFLYPEDSAINNVNSPEVEPMTAKMWWHK